jgi:hypothetical protein
MDRFRNLAKEWAALRLLRGAIIALRDGGDGSSDAHYARVAAEFGYASNALARASFEEIDGNWSTVDAKLTQMFERHLP